LPADGGGDYSIGLNGTYLDARRFGVAYTGYFRPGGTFVEGSDITTRTSTKDRDFVSISSAPYVLITRTRPCESTLCLSRPLLPPLPRSGRAGAVNTEDAAKLKSELMPLGGEKAGNKDGPFPRGAAV
jgi:hypothetical protein